MARASLYAPTLQRLNPRQREAVKLTTTPVLVLAGAGTGKTGVISEKVAYLINKRGIAAEQVVAITFTNKAAAEMKERVGRLLGKAKSKPWISTFHTFGLRILREACSDLGYRPGFTILDAGDCGNLISDLMRRDAPGTDLDVYQVQQAISAIKNSLGSRTENDGTKSSPVAATAARCFEAYCEALLTYNAVDFDDLICAPIKLLRTNQTTLRHWQDQVGYMLVDEYQDTNLAQYELVRLLVGQRGNLTAVGDDDQSIYAWRGARPENMNQLATDFKDLALVKLEQNYRSTGIILKAANTLIANNPHTFDKRLWSESGFGEKIRVFMAASEHDETERIANDILHTRLLKRSSFSDFAVLIRSNHQARLFESAFRERNIPYVLSGSRSFFDYSEIKDCVSYLRVLANPDDNNALLRIINTPRRSIGTQSVKTLVQVAGELGLNLLEAATSNVYLERVSPRVFKHVNGFAEWALAFRQQYVGESPVAAFRQLLKDIDYDDWLERSSPDEASAIRRKENVTELSNWIDRIEKNGEHSDISDIVAALTLYDIAERRENDQDDAGVALTTLHAAKGLEYPHVYLAGFEENLLPHRSSIQDDDIEEERRLAYVGITRAQKTLTITSARTRKRYGQIETCEPSRFLNELPQDELLLEGKSADPEANRETGRGTLDNLKRLLES